MRIRCNAEKIKYRREIKMSGWGRGSFNIEKDISAKKKRNNPAAPSITTKEINEEIFSVVFAEVERFRSVRVVPEVIKTIISTLKVMITAT